jgi:type IV pilus assembly protein PilY1
MLTLLVGLPAYGDDTELFVGTSGGSAGGQPNVLLIIDTSGSMNDLITTGTPYDPTQTYSGSCDPSRVYFSTRSTVPSCGSTFGSVYFDASSNYCQHAKDAFALSGFYIGRMAQFRSTGWWHSSTRWQSITYSQPDKPVECADDQPDPASGYAGNGDGVDTTKVYAINTPSSTDPGPWTADSSNAVSWPRTGQIYTVYSANYLNWYYGPSRQSTPKIDIVKQVATNLVDSVSGLNFGLMRYNENVWSNQDGGPVIFPMENVATGRSSLDTVINNLPANGNTPLAETMYEAHQYYTGGSVVYGNECAPDCSVPGSRKSTDSTNPDYNVYKTPIQYECQKNYIVYLSDGLPTSDTEADSKITSLPDFAKQTGSGTCSGDCLDELAQYMSKEDLSPSLDGNQTVTTYTIGFNADIPVLQDAAAKSGGKYYQANDTTQLASALSSIVTSILRTSTTFVSPTVSVNSFNRTQNLNDLYITMFEPTGVVHWPGNLKKYHLDPTNGTIVDVNSQPAIATVTAGNDVAGFFKSTSQSYWSSTVDGNDVTAGGAAHQLPDPANRNLYTCLGCSSSTVSLTAPGNAVTTTNTALSNTVLNIGAAGDPSRTDLINFMRGVDVTDVDQDPTTTVRHQMGDPLHGHPAPVAYNSTTSIIYFATNDGYVHAINANDGTERWAFVPQEFLPDQKLLFEDDTTSSKHYGVDGNMRVQVDDKNGNGIIDGSDTVHLYFGMRRGGDMYYALDVTNPDNPQFMWELTSADVPSGLGQTWSNPVPTRINVSGATYDTNNTDKQVLVFGAGYDTSEDNTSQPATPDAGNGIVVVDAWNGNVLWYASNTGGDLPSGPSRDRMLYSFPSDVRVVDLDGDKFADRMYAADMGGQVWRFDIVNGQPVSSVIRGGVIAQLGGAPSASPAPSETRRFYYAPDAALVTSGPQDFMNIGIGSGQRAHPNSTTAHDKFYSLRDYNPFTTLTQTQFDSRSSSPIMDADLVDITNNLTPQIPDGSPGWKLDLVDSSGAWLGEKVLAESRTFDNKIYFTTFTPNNGAANNGCVPKLGTNKLYVVDLLTGAPVTNLDKSVDPTQLTASDRSEEFNGSLSSEVVFLFPSPDNPGSCVGSQCRPPPVACVDLFCFPPGFMNNPVRTTWREESVDN